MSLTRRSGQRFQSSIWPGFVDAMTALLLVLMFVLSIFMIVQFMLRETITGQETELNELNLELSALADSLGLERRRGDSLENDLSMARAEANAQAALVASLTAQVNVAEGRIQGFEAQVAALLAQQADLETALSDEQAARQVALADAAALRGDLSQAGDELAALTLALEQERVRAEETLTLLAAARLRAETANAEKLSEAEKNAALLAVARGELATQQALSEESQRKIELLNQQVTALRGQLGALQSLLDASAERDADANVQIEALGSQLNAALAQVASEQRARAALEEAERQRLEEEAARLKSEAAKLENYRSEFFGRLREVLAGREGVQIVGDRFVFSSEVLFEPASADLSPEGRAQIARVAELLSEVSGDIPDSIDWIIRVDGHTDNVPLGGAGQFRDNWELSQGRALSVVRYMTDQLGFPSRRLAATGFGEYQPVNAADTPAARAQNRRIELKLTER